MELRELCWEISATDLPSLKLTARLWKWMVGIRSFPIWGPGLFSGDMLVSGSVDGFFGFRVFVFLVFARRPGGTWSFKFRVLEWGMSNPGPEESMGCAEYHYTGPLMTGCLGEMDDNGICVKDFDRSW